MRTTQQTPELEAKRTVAEVMNKFIEQSDYADLSAIDVTDWDEGEAGDYEELIVLRETRHGFMQAREQWAERGTLEKGEKFGIDNVFCIRGAQARRGEQRKGLILCEHDNKLFVWEF